MKKPIKAPSRFNNKLSINSQPSAKNWLLWGFIILLVGFLFPKSIEFHGVKEIVAFIIILGLVFSYIGYFKLSKISKIESQIYLRESRTSIFVILGLFIVSILLGFILNSSLEEIFNPIIKDLMSQVDSLNGPSIIPFIFLNNIGASFIGLFAGIIFVISLYVTITNGSMIGYVLAKVYEVSGVGEFWRLFPHGVFELPAILISLALGMKMGLFFVSKHPYFELKKRFYNSILIFLKVVVPLLIAAAIIEGILIIILN